MKPERCERSLVVEQASPLAGAGSIPSRSLQPRVVEVDKKTCEKFITAKHYSRRMSIFWYGFGLLVGGHIEGVAVYGQPSPPIQKHAFRDRDFRLLELCRVVVQTALPNAASFLVGRSLQMLPKPCAVVSYADSEWGHAGIIYQATNWIYTGATKSHDHSYLVDGVRTHPMTLRDRGIKDPKRWARENGVATLAPAPKHRYFFTVGTRRERTAIRSKLTYPIVDKYPKLPKATYDAGPPLNVPWPLDIWPPSAIW